MPARQRYRCRRGPPSGARGPVCRTRSRHTQLPTPPARPDFCLRSLPLRRRSPACRGSPSPPAPPGPSAWASASPPTSSARGSRARAAACVRYREGVFTRQRRVRGLPKRGGRRWRVQQWCSCSAVEAGRQTRYATAGWLLMALHETVRTDSRVQLGPVLSDDLRALRKGRGRASRRRAGGGGCVRCGKATPGAGHAGRRKLLRFLLASSER